MKYVMFKTTGRLVEHIPVIFPNKLIHKDIAEALLKSEQFRDMEIHSAGEISPLDCKAHGESITLKIKSDPKDSDRILMNDYGAGYS